MLDGKARRLIDPIINMIGGRLAQMGITPNQITIIGFALGVCAAIFINYHFYWLGLIFIIISRLADGLDGSVARAQNKTSDFGGFLDITLDFGFYGLIPLAFIFSDPHANSMAGAVLLLSFYINGASFLAYAIMAEKRGLKESLRGKKSLFYTTGLAEASETIIVFILFCLFPSKFSLIAYLFALVVYYTAFARIMLARQMFNDAVE